MTHRSLALATLKQRLDGRRLCRRLVTAGFALGAILIPNLAVHAQQSPECQRYRAQLVALERQGPGTAAGLADKQRGELSQLVNYYRSLGCERGPFALFAGPPPAECPSIAQRIRRMEANYSQLQSQAGGYRAEFDARRRQLQAAIAQVCSGSAPPPDNRGFFDRLFGAPPPQERPVAPHESDEEETEPRYGGRRVVCVRSCDGYFFPLSNMPSGKSGANDMCQALCPSTETQAYSMPGGDKAIEYAISLSGQRYNQLPNALRYTREFVASCTCKPENETWAQVSGRAEDMLSKRKGDIVVTAEKSKEMARPKETPAQKSKRSAEEAQIEAETKAAASSGEAAPTASSESSGIGQTIEDTKVVDEEEGPRETVTDEHGDKKTIRIIAPNIIPPPPNTTR